MTVLDRQLRLSINPALIDKNEAKDNSLFKSGWQNQRLTPIELAECIHNGWAYCCELSGSRRAANFLASDILSVDIDGTARIDDMLAHPILERHLTILYTTVRHTDQTHRFRLIFVLPRTIETAKEMVAASRSLALRLSGDLASTDASRISYGSRGSDPMIFERCMDETLLDELIAQGLDADQRDSVAANATKASTVSRLTIAPDLVVRRPTGEPVAFASLGNKESICCPFHSDTNASAFTVASTVNGAIGIHCSTCDQTFWPSGSTDQRYDFWDFDKRVQEADRYFKANEDMGAIHKFLFDESNPRRSGLMSSNVALMQSDFLQLPPTLPRGNVFVKSPKGTGKTEEIKTTIQADEGSVLLIGHRITLIRQSCQRLGLECYLDFEGRIQSDRIGICLDSLLRLRSRGKGPKAYRTVIIDESEQVLSHFFSDTINAATREAIFVDFTNLLQRADRVVALDADLGWLTFETLSKLSQVPGAEVRREAHIFVNDRPNGAKLHMYESYHHLVGELMACLADDKRVFVTSNSLGLVNKLVEATKHQFGENFPVIAITSETKDREDVKAFVLNPTKLALQYQAILCSPSLGTGVDITFHEQEQNIDVVFGFFESNVNTHFDLDQQLARVRHPGAVRVWINPRRFRFETAVDVVRRDIQVNGLYKNVLRGYDKDGKPEYHTDDPLIDMAALAVSQQRASKNNLRGNFIDLKRRQGFQVDFVTSDTALAMAGSEADAIGSNMATAARVAQLVGAKTLSRAEHDDIEGRVKDNDDVSDHERWRLARTKIELFYRRPLDEVLVAADDRGRARSRIVRYEAMQRFIETKETRNKFAIADLPDRYGLRARFIRDERKVSELLYDLLSATSVFDEGVFDTQKSFSFHDLGGFHRKCLSLKAIIENLLEMEVSTSEKSAVKQFGAVLRVVGLGVIEAGKSKAGGRTTYAYRIDSTGIASMNKVTAWRRQHPAWTWLNQHYGLPVDAEKG